MSSRPWPGAQLSFQLRVHSWGLHMGKAALCSVSSESSLAVPAGVRGRAEGGWDLPIVGVSEEASLHVPACPLSPCCAHADTYTHTCAHMFSPHMLVPVCTTSTHAHIRAQYPHSARCSHTRVLAHNPPHGTQTCAHSQVHMLTHCIHTCSMFTECTRSCSHMCAQTPWLYMYSLTYTHTLSQIHPHCDMSLS